MKPKVWQRILKTEDWGKRFELLLDKNNYSESMTKHSENCEAPICFDDPKPNHVWWAGEPICNKRPYNEVQKRQTRINKEIKEDRCWTLKELEDSSL